MSLNLERLNWMPSPPLVPEDFAIDIQHLGRMTLGEAALEAEVLALFSAQSGEIVTRLKTSPPDAAALAHTLKGSARAIGAFRVAEAALGVEAAMKNNGDLGEAIALLQQAVTEAQEAIGRMLKRS
ncbi:MAG: Hpt domain-containing protein [Afipia sp.]|nr:MAG: Hpt domain-containing protein [Afipia sp.]